MAVIINDFEVVLQPEEPAAPGGAAGVEPAPPPRPPKPQDIVAVMRWHEARLARLRAT